jgi:hypothetical protein
MTIFRSNAKNKIQADEPVLAINTFAGGFDVADLVSKLGIDILFIDCERPALASTWWGPWLEPLSGMAQQRWFAAKPGRLRTG